MKKQFAAKQLTLVMVVLATLFVSNLEIALDHHDLDKLPVNFCPVCAFSHTLSFVECSLSVLSVAMNYCLIAIHFPTERSFSYNPVYVRGLQNRAPPFAVIG
jgi:hypothetical protein